MFDIAWSEMLLLVVLTILVVGPKDLPKVLRSIGKFTAKARSMASEFYRSIDQMAREADIEELRTAANEVKNFSPQKAAKKFIDPDDELGSIMDPMNSPVKSPSSEAEESPIPQPDLIDDEPDSAPDATPETARRCIPWASI